MKLQILLSESDPVVRQDWAKALEHEGFEVNPAEGLRETLYRFCTQDSDVAIVSLGSPAEEGLRLLRLMKQFRALCPVLAAVPEPNEYAGVFQPGLDMLLQKPMAAEQLVKAIKTMVSGWKPELLEPEPTESLEPPFRISPRGGGRHYRKRTQPLPKAASNY